MKAGLRNSLRLRLIIGSAAGVVLALLLATLFIGNLYRIHATEGFQSELDHHLEELIALTVLDAQGRPAVRQPLSDPQFNVAGSGLYWQVETATGRVDSPSLADRHLIPASDDRWHSGTAGNETVRQRSVRVRQAGQPLTVTMASAEQLLEQQVRDFRSDLTRSVIVVGLLLLAGAAALVRFGLTPVWRLGDEVDRLRHGEIDRLDPRVPAEFSPVVERINALLEGQAQLIARARTESGNLAHNLRTPLALIADEAEQLALSGQRQSAEFLLERCRTMQRQIDYHLARAAAAGTRGTGTLTEVEPVLAPILEAMHRLHADRAISVSIELPPGFRLPCDHGDLAEILSNLIDNAFKWASSRIVIAGAPNRIEVRDDGRGIPAELRARVTNVGTRLDPATPGTGIGLAATADLLRFYDGRLELGDAPEGGLSAVARF